MTFLRVPRHGTPPLRAVENHTDSVDGRGGKVYVLALECGHEMKRRELSEKVRCGRCLKKK